MGMDNASDLRAPLVSRPATGDRTTLDLLSQIQHFSNFVAAPRRPEELLAEAARVLHGALPDARVLVVDRVVGSLRCRYSAGSGWGGVSSQRLGAALHLLIEERPGPPATGRVSGRSDSRTERLIPGDVDRLNDDLRSWGGSQPVGAAVRVTVPMRGHEVRALLAWPEPAREIDEEGVRAGSILVSVLATALEIALRKRQVAQRLNQIRRAKTAWEGTVDALPDIVCVLNADGTVSRANRAIETWGLGSVTCSAFGTLHDLLHPGCDRPECGLSGRLDEALAHRSNAVAQELEYADPGLGRQLRIKLGHVKASTSPDRTAGRGPLYVVIQDITREQNARQRAKKANDELRRNLQHSSIALSTTSNELHAATSKLATVELELVETRRRHRLVLENTIAGLVMVRGGKISYANRRFEELLGYPRGALLGASIDAVMPLARAPLALLGPTVDSDANASQQRVVQATREDGSAIWIRCSVVEPSHLADHSQYITVVDATDQIRAERAARVSRQKLQQLTGSLISSQEDERKRISGDLHDGIGQGLSAVKLMLSNLVADSRREPGEPGEAPVRMCIAKTQEMIDEVRRISMALRPSIIDTGGVLLALSRLCEEVTEVARGISVHWTSEVIERDIADTLKIHIFRITQEALNNVIKHAHASTVWVELERREGGLRLSIRDDGIGFDPGQVDGRHAGLGLSGIRQRVRLHDGEVTIESHPGKGTTIQAAW